MIGVGYSPNTRTDKYKAIINNMKFKEVLMPAISTNGTEIQSFYLWSTLELEETPESCRYCPNHPLKGGSGVCYCTLGGNKIK